MDAQTVIQIVGAISLVLTAAASFLNTLLGLGNRWRANAIKASVDDTKASVDQIFVNVDGRYSTTQDQMGQLLKHMMSLNPEIAAKAAAEVLAVADKKADRDKLSR